MLAAKTKTSFLSSVFKDVIHSRDGTEISVRCPYCGKPGKSKMCIIVDTDVYHCWVCDEKGRGLAKLIKKEKPDKVGEYLANHASINKKANDDVKEEKINIDLPDDFKLIVNGDRSDPNWKAIAKYALNRGFNKSTMWSMRVGYSNEFAWNRRLIITSFDQDGELNYITGRSIDPENSFRYKNLSAPRNTLVFNEIDIDWSTPLLLAEGPLDLVKVKHNKTCLLGSTLNKESLLFQRIVENCTPVILILDRDAKKKALKIAEDLTEYSISVKIAFPPDDKDLNDLMEDEIEQLISSAQQYDYKLKLKIKLGNDNL